MTIGSCRSRNEESSLSYVHIYSWPEIRNQAKQTKNKYPYLSICLHQAYLLLNRDEQVPRYLLVQRQE